MRSNELVLENYNTDKINSHYLDRYDPILAPWLDKEIVLLELGVYQGGSLLLWRDYFPHAEVVGVDIQLPEDFPATEGIHLFKGSQDDLTFLEEVARSTAPAGFDIIIDDASHIGELTKKSFWYLFDHHLKPGGLYVIEDWGTGYWEDWVDGKGFEEATAGQTGFLEGLLSKFGVQKKATKRPFPCHSYGMVGFVKELVDEQAAADLTRGSYSAKPQRLSRFEKLLITPSLVFVWKAAV